MLSWAVAVLLVFVLLLIWSALYRHGLLWGSEADVDHPPDGGAERVSEPSRER